METILTASYLDLLLEIAGKGKLKTKLYDFSFCIVNSPLISGNISSANTYGVFLRFPKLYLTTCSCTTLDNQAFGTDKNYQYKSFMVVMDSQIVMMSACIMGTDLSTVSHSFLFLFCLLDIKYFISNSADDSRKTGDAYPTRTPDPYSQCVLSFLGFDFRLKQLPVDNFV